MGDRTDRFYHVDLKDWVYGTIDKVRNDGEKWNNAWLDTYRELGGLSVESGKKSCPKCAAKTLYKLGYIKDTDRPFRECDIPKLWRTPGYKNGVYAIIAIRLLSQNRDLDEAELWREVKKVVRAETEEKPAASNQGGPDFGPAALGDWLDKEGRLRAVTVYRTRLHRPLT